MVTNDVAQLLTELRAQVKSLRRQALIDAYLKQPEAGNPCSLPRNVRR
jgi:hypothetical protein